MGRVRLAVLVEAQKRAPGLRLDTPPYDLEDFLLGQGKMIIFSCAGRAQIVPVTVPVSPYLLSFSNAG